MLDSRALALLLAVGMLAVGAAAKYSHSRAKVRSGLPAHEYRVARYSQAVRAISSVAVPIPAAPTPTNTNGSLLGKTFQFVDTPVLQIDHCSISELSVQIYDNGVWTVNLRADQNPVDGPVDATRKVTTAEPSRKFTEHLQGNQFHVRVHCFANHGPVARRSLLGKSQVISLNVDPFWVQKGVSLPRVVPGNSGDVQAFFPQIDRVEAEFYYRID